MCCEQLIEMDVYVMGKVNLMAHLCGMHLLVSQLDT